MKKGNYDLKQINADNIEVATLCCAFDEMALSVKNNITNIQENAQLEKKLLEQENENLKIKELLIDTKLKALQSQINPHFLFNTLSLLSNMAYMEGAENTSELMELTSDLLRYSLNKSSEISDLNGEWECIKNYIYIQSKRFGERVEFTCNIGEDVPNIKIPGMILQPLVENCIVHGVRDKLMKGKVNISISKIVNGVEIVVEDNGKGFSKEIIEKVCQWKTNSIYSADNTKGIGLSNVIQRLNLYYSNSYEIALENKMVEGSKIILNIYI